MKLSNRYNVPQETIDKMVNDGLIGCQWPTYEKVYEDFVSLSIDKSRTKTGIYIDLGIKYNMSERNIKMIIQRLGKL